MTRCTRRTAALFALALGTAACSGSEPPEVAAPVPTTILQTTTVPTTAAPAPTTAAVETTTPPTAEEPPESLAFTSSRDVGRLYELDASAGAIFAAQEAGGDADIGPISSDSVVVALRARSRSGELWVLLGRPGEDEAIGWVPAAQLMATDKVIETFDADNEGQFRRVVNVRSSSFLNVRAGATSESDAVGQLGPNATFMHGGTSAIGGDGETWVDVIDATSGSRIGWVLDRFTAEASGVEAQTGDGVDASPRPDRDAGYGAAIGSAGLTAFGCNASQLTVTGDGASTGTGILYGTSAAYDDETGRWSLAGGGAAWIDAGQTLVLTVPRDVPVTWYLVAVDESGVAVAQPSLDGGAAVVPTSVGDLLSFDVSSSYCGPPPPPPAPGTEDLDDGFILDLEDSGIDVEDLSPTTTEAPADGGTGAEGDAGGSSVGGGSALDVD